MNLARIITLSPRIPPGRDAEAHAPETMPPGADREQHAISLWERGDLEAAAAAWSEILKREPSRLAARLQLATCYQQMGRWEDAARELGLCLPMTPEDPDLLTHLAICYLHSETLAHALVLLDQALRLKPDHRLAGEAMALCEQRQAGEPGGTRGAGLLVWEEPEAVPAQPEFLTHFEETRERLEEILWLDPENGRALFLLAFLHHREGRKGRAARLYEQAVRANPQAWQPAFNLALLRFEQGEGSSARMLLDRVLLLKPDCADGTWMLGQTHEQQGDRREAEFWYERTVALDPQAEDAWFRLGQLALERREWVLAAERFERCGTDHYEAGFNAGLCRRRIGDLDEARALWKRSAGLHPERPEALVAWAALELESGNQAGAESIESRLRQPHAGLSLALAETAGSTGEAIRHYRRALEAEPEHAQAWVNLGTLLREEGDEAGAAEAWREAVRCDAGLAAEYFG